ELSKPYYTRRPVIELPETAMLTPQTHEGTMAGASDEAVPPPAPPPPASSPVATAPGVVGGVPGGVAGGVLGSLTKSGNNVININGRLAKAEAEEKAAENLEPAANGQELGDLFQYNLKEKVTILKNHSALVPIINSHIKAEKVTLWSRESSRP